MFIVFSSMRSPDGSVLGGLPTGLLIVFIPVFTFMWKGQTVAKVLPFTTFLTI